MRQGRVRRPLVGRQITRIDLADVRRLRTNQSFWIASGFWEPILRVVIFKETEGVVGAVLCG
jgi:hypothetical protein